MATIDGDFLIIGAGIAGAGAAAELSRHGKAILLEREDQPGYHTTGRSAAIYSETYGNAVVRAITTASKAFYFDPPAGFAEHALVTPRGALFFGAADRMEALHAKHAESHALVPTVELIAARAALGMVPVLRPECCAGAVWEPEAADIDVHAIHQGFLRGLKARGGTVVLRGEVQALRPGDDGHWAAQTLQGSFRAPVVVNAAGAWCDEIARLAGVRTVGLVPKRRTAFTFPGPEGVDVSRWPLVLDIDEQFYFKPEAGLLLASPANEDPVAPHDVQPEELDVAIAVDRLEQATTLTVRKLGRKWAGLRSFVADKSPVVGFAPDAPGFFWLAGQGGYGIQTAPAMARLAAALAVERRLPEDLRALGVKEADLAADRAGLARD